MLAIGIIIAFCTRGKKSKIGELGFYLAFIGWILLVGELAHEQMHSPSNHGGAGGDIHF
jgi:hypothetical protein